MRKRLMVGISAALVLLVIGLGIFRLAKRNQTPTIKIGAVLPLTGPAASIGKAAKDGLLLSVEDVNAQGGVRSQQVELILEDGAGEPRTSISAFHKLVDVDGAKFIVTTLSSVGMSLAPLAEREQIVLFADAAHPDLTKGRPFVFRHSNVADQEVEAILAHLALSNPKARVSSLVVEDDYGFAIAQSIRGQIAAYYPDLRLESEETYPKAETDFRAHVLRLMAVKPDCIVVGGLSTSMGLAIRRLKEQGYGGRVYVTLPFVLLPDAIAAAGQALSGVCYNTFALQDNAAVAQLEQRYVDRFKEKMPVSTAIEYNTMRLLLDAIEKTSYDPTQVDSYLRSLRVFDGLGERIILNGLGDAASPVVVKQFE
jgi:branched-chain amino acid transport system substrate-binding protein